PRRSDHSMSLNPEVTTVPRFSIYQIMAAPTRVKAFRTDPVPTQDIGGSHDHQTAIAVAGLRGRPRVDHAERRTGAIATGHRAPDGGLWCRRRHRCRWENAGREVEGL